MNSNTQLVQQCYAAFKRGNIPAVLDLLDEDIVWTDAGYPEVPHAGTYYGRSGVAEFFDRLGRETDFLQFEPREYWSDGDMVFVKGFSAATIRSSGRSFETDWLMVWKLKGGKVRTFNDFYDTAKVLKAYQSTSIAAPIF